MLWTVKRLAKYITVDNYFVGMAINAHNPFTNVQWEANSMKALVVYDSVFGNTEKVAQKIGEALGAPAIRVGDVKSENLTNLDVLVVGSPTRGFNPTPGIKKWLNRLDSGSLRGVNVAAFDTRIDVEETNVAILTAMVKVFGYAAKPIGNKLVKKGGDLRMPPEGFVVNDSEGPLRDGKLERAAGWARHMLPD